MKGLLAFITGFIIVCLLALFVAWIGAVEPFTEEAGEFAGFTFFIATLAGVFSVLPTIKTSY